VERCRHRSWVQQQGARVSRLASRTANVEAYLYVVW
jgi:hypothetical protein